MWHQIDKEYVSTSNEMRAEIMGPEISECIMEITQSDKPKPRDKEDTMEKLRGMEKDVQIKAYMGWVVELLIIYLMSYLIVLFVFKKGNKI